jgi:hypothetical protein
MFPLDGICWAERSDPACSFKGGLIALSSSFRAAGWCTTRPPPPPLSEFHVDDNRRRICTEYMLYVPGDSLPRAVRLSCAFPPGKKLFGSSITSSDRASNPSIHPSIHQSVVTFAGEYVMLGLTNLYSVFQPPISEFRPLDPRKG